MPISKERDHFSGECRMTSDFENDEIKDSSFPIDFTDDTTALDMYGVWVKSGPRDVLATPKRSLDESFSDTVTFTDFSSAADLSAGAESPEEKENPLDEFDGLDSLPDLPDFPDFDLTDTPSAPTESESPEAVYQETSDTTEFENITPFELDEPVTTDGDSFVAEPFEEIEFENINFSADDEAPAEDSRADLDNAVTPEPFDLAESLNAEEVAFSFPEDESEEQAKTGFDALVEPEDEDVASESLTDEFLEPEIELQRPEAHEMAKETVESDGIVELDETDGLELSVEDFLSASESSPSEAIPAEDDFSSFLDDINAAPVPQESGAGDFDLDSLINSVNEAGSLGQEKENIFDDNEPLNIELEFDESFIEDAEKIRATGSSVSESEFFNSEFGVELVDETSSGQSNESTETSADFDAMFAEIQEPEQKKASEPKEAASSSFLEETSEFDDLLMSLDAAPVPAPVSDKGKTPIPASKGFNLAVTEEESVDSLTTSVSESASDEDFSVSLFGTETFVPAAPKQEYPVKAQDSSPEVLSEEPIMVTMADIPDVAFTADEKTESFEEIPSLSPDVTLDAVPVPVNDEEIVDITPFTDYNTTESYPDSEISGITSVEETVSLDFDDISAVEKDLNEEIPVTGEDTVVTNDKSTELLMIIADELSSIKKEISTLKTELAGFKAGAAPEGLAQQAPGAETENSGFFSDDDTDETIALTGDELNNILITADFTEEKSEEALPGEPSITAEPQIEEDVSVSGFESLGSMPGDENGIDIPDTLPETIFDVPGFDSSTEIEVSHVNSITDDVSYLEGSDSIEPDLDNVAIEEPELEIIDFEDEKLVEPELTEFNIDLTDMEKDFPAEQEITVPESFAVEELAVPESGVDEFATTDTLSEQELAAIQEDISIPEPAVAADQSKVPQPAMATLPVELKDEIKSVLSYMDQLLESLPEEKIEEFARSEHFEVYKKLFEELGIS
jgi:hypothetical protein